MMSVVEIGGDDYFLASASTQTVNERILSRFLGVKT